MEKVKKTKIANIYFLEHSFIEWDCEETEESIKKLNELEKLFENECLKQIVNICNILPYYANEIYTEH